MSNSDYSEAIGRKI